MKASLFKELETYVIFDKNILASIVKNESYASLLAHRLKKAGEILEIERNKYTVHKDAFLIASRITWPSYISIWSALRYHNLTEQIPHDIYVITTNKRRNVKIEFAGSNIFFIIVSPKYFFGYDKIDFRGFEIFVADPEKSIIDSLLLRRVSVSEIHGLLKSNLDDIRTNRLADYAIRTGNKALIKRLGYMLEKLNASVQRKLEKYVYPAYTPLEYNLPANGRQNDKWKLIENVEL